MHIFFRDTVICFILDASSSVTCGVESRHRFAPATAAGQGMLVAAILSANSSW